MFRSFSVTLALLCGAAPALAANQLVNPGFETGLLAPWTNDNDFCAGCTWSVDAADAHSGTYSAVVDGNRLILQTFAPVPVSSINAVNFWARHPNDATGADIAVYFEYSDLTDEEALFQTSDSAWTFFDVTSELDSSKSLTGFGVYGNSGTLARFDDAVVDVVPEPATRLHFATGAAWLISRRRR
jgi:hypothetical protein